VTTRYCILAKRGSTYSLGKVGTALESMKRYRENKPKDTSWYVYSLDREQFLIVTDHIIYEVTFCCVIDANPLVAGPNGLGNYLFAQAADLRNYLFAQAAELLLATSSMETFEHEIN
jgi:hypothetical protein